MGGKYEIRFYDNKGIGQVNGGYRTIYTNSWTRSVILRLTKDWIYFKIYR
jgi:hypothetical protein